METNYKSVSDFINTKRTFSISEFDSFFVNYFSIHKDFPEFTINDIPKLNEAIRDNYRIEFKQKSAFIDKTFVISKLGYIVRKIMIQQLEIFKYYSIPGYYNDTVNMFAEHLIFTLNSEIVDFSNQLYEEKSTLPVSEKFSYGEVANLIHLLRSEGLFRPGINQNEIAFYFHQLTGYGYDTLNNVMSKNSFSNNKALLSVRTDLQRKLDKMSNSLL